MWVGVAAFALAGCATTQVSADAERQARREELMARRAAREGDYNMAAAHQRSAERIREESIEQRKEDALNEPIVAPPAGQPGAPAPMPVPVPTPAPLP